MQAQIEICYYSEDFIHFKEVYGAIIIIRNNRREDKKSCGATRTEISKTLAERLNALRIMNAQLSTCPTLSKVIGTTYMKPVPINQLELIAERLFMQSFDITIKSPTK